MNGRHEDMGDRARNLEEQFFLEQERKTLARRREERLKHETREGLAALLGARDERLLNRLLELKLTPETAASLGLVPLVQVAWADGELDERERQAVLDAADAIGVKLGGFDHSLLEQWLSHRPDPALLQAWVHYVRQLRARCTPEEIAAFRTAVLGRARGVAEAAGGFLGFGNRVSESEAAVLRELETAFDEPGSAAT